MKKFVRSILEENFLFSKISRKAIRTKNSIHFDDRFYSLLRRHVGSVETGEFIKINSTMGNCYFYALLLARSFPNCELKLGALHRLDRSVQDCYYEVFEHSWVERGNFVYDTSAKQIFDKKFYYKYFCAEVLKTYDFGELRDENTFCSLGINAVKNRPELVNSLFLCEEMKKVSKEKFVEELQNINDLGTQKYIAENYEKNQI